jgi:hypothetical protein
MLPVHRETVMNGQVPFLAAAMTDSVYSRVGGSATRIMCDRLTRRRVLGGLAAASIAGVAGCGEPATEEGSPEDGTAGGEEESPAGGTGTETGMGEEETT